jgi:D-erythronate 2-dehydrogenase
MRVVVIGSEGFIGEALIARLLRDTPVGEPGLPATLITRVDGRMVTASTTPRVRCIEGELGDRAALNRAFEGGVDCVFHLASVSGAAAEQNFPQGLRVNLQATIELLESLRVGGLQPRLVFASTLEVYGASRTDVIDEQTVPSPSSSHGAHKYMSEVLVSDYGRRGLVDGCSVRIPGVVACPATEGADSIFLSNLIRELAAGQNFICPVAANAPAWWMSRACSVDNLLHAASLPASVLTRQRSFLLPVLRLTISEVVQALVAVYGPEISARISYQPDAALQAQCASHPPLHCPRSEFVGFRNDGSALSLVRRALDPA